MTEKRRPEPSIDARREKAVETLMEHFANDVLEVEEFERRLDVANRSRTAAELDELLADLPTAAVPAVRPRADVAPLPDLTTVSADQVRDRSYVVAVMGGTERKGRWVPARRMNVFTLMGGAGLDFREAMLGPGVTEIWIFAMWGGVEILVPPGMAVEVDGFALMGGFDFETNQPPVSDPDRPLLRIRGMACMGGVGVEVRHVGESAKDARRRRKLAKKARKQIGSGGA